MTKEETLDVPQLQQVLFFLKKDHRIYRHPLFTVYDKAHGRFKPIKFTASSGMNA
jgi:hypothetical protein